MEHETECKVSAFEVPVPGSNGYEYALVMICDAPQDLPDGRYHSLSIAARSPYSDTMGRGWFY